MPVNNYLIASRYVKMELGKKSIVFGISPDPLRFDNLHVVKSNGRNDGDDPSIYKSNNTSAPTFKFR